ncbi:MAG: protein kinase [Kofleriaceae bacterium]
MDSQPQFEDPLIGQVVGGMYQIVRRIGMGGMGAVYEAKHIRLPKRFAIKHLKKHHTRDSVAMARFQREAEIASSLGNRHIAEVFDFNVMPDGSPYMVMELLEGEDLRSRLRRGPLELREALEICEQVVSALSAVHERGVVHRDLKPENIFLLPGEAGGVLVKLVDFGLSKVHGDTAMTQSGSLFGTPAYMSPEQARSEVKEADHRTDIYSLAAVMFEALTGRPPFTGETVYALLWNIVNQEPPSAHDRFPSVPEKVAEVLQWAMAKVPAARPESAVELLIAVEGAIEGTSNDLKSFESWRRERTRSIDIGVRHGPASSSSSVSPSSPDQHTERIDPAAIHSELARRHPSTIDPYGKTAVPGGGARPLLPLTHAQPHRPASRDGAAAENPFAAEPTALVRPTHHRFVLAALAAGVVVASVIVIVTRSSSDRARPAPRYEATAPLDPTRSSPTVPGGSASTPAPPPTPAPPKPQPIATPEPVSPSRPRPIERVTISVSSNPSGAEVWLRGQRLGTTPTKVSLPRGSKRVSLTLRKDGYLDKVITVTPDRVKPLSVELEFRRFGGGARPK